MTKKIGKHKINVKYLVIVLAVAIVICVVLSTIGSTFSMVYVQSAQEKTVSKVLDSQAYILRKETYVTNDQGGVLYYNVGDASAVEANGVIADVYQSETDAINIKKINSTSNEINNLKKLNTMSNAMGISIESIDNSLNNRLNNLIENVRDNNFLNSSSDVNNLLYSLNQKQIVTGNTSNFNDRISNLEAQNGELVQSVKNKLGQVLSPVAGVFVSTTDGYENVFDCSNIKNITYADVSRAVSTKPQKVADNVVGKVISDINWYICCPISADDSDEFTVGGNVRVDIPYASTESIPAEVIKICNDPSGKNAIVVLQCENMNETLAKIRSEEVKVSVKTYTGLSIPKKAIHKAEVLVEGTKDKKKEVDGVYILYGSELKFLEIIKLYEQGDYVICDPNVDQDDKDKKLVSGSTIKLYDKIVTEGTDLYAGKIVKQSTEVE